MGWVRVDTTLPTHDKIYNMSDALNITIPQAVGHIVMLWLWASINAPDGDISKYKPRAIADAARWAKSAQKFYDVLLNLKFCDIDNGVVTLHNWDMRQELLIDSSERKKAKTRERVERYRARKKLECNESGSETPASTESDSNADSNVAPALQSNDVTPLTSTSTETSTVLIERNTRACVELWEKITGDVIPRDMVQEIIARLNMDTDVELVKEGIRLSAGKANPAAYMRKCLQNWTAEGIKTYQDYCKRNKASNTPKPTADLSSPETYADVEGDDLD